MDRIELLDPAHSYLPSHASWEAIWTSEGHYLEYRYMAVSQTTKLMENVNTVHSVIRVDKICPYCFDKINNYMPYASYFVQISMTPMVFCYIPYVSICGQTLVKYVECIWMISISSLAISPHLQPGWAGAETSLYSTFSTVVDFLEMPAEAPGYQCYLHLDVS